MKYPGSVARALAAPARRVGARPIFCGYLALIAGAEIVASLVDLHLGMVAHLALVLALVAHGALGRTEGERNMALALTVAPLIRLLSLSLPLARFPQVAWYPMVSIPLLAGVFYLARQIGVTRPQLGLVGGKVPVQLLLAGGGLGIGVLEYAILRPHSMLTEPSAVEAAAAALSLLIFTGFSEELIFRGLLQSLAAPLFRRFAPLYISVLFGVLHIGYLSVLDVVFVSAVGLIFAYAVRWGRSILGVTLAHGLTNITLFILMPYVAQQAPGDVAAAFYCLVAGAAFLALASFLLLRRQAARREREVGSGPRAQTARGEHVHGEHVHGEHLHGEHLRGDFRLTAPGLAAPVNGDGR